MCWINVYLGPSDFIGHHAEKNFVRAAIQANADMLYIWTKSMLASSVKSKTIVEQYHFPISFALNVKRKEDSI